MLDWKNDFFKRLQKHMKRVSLIKNNCDNPKKINEYAPQIIAFTGKRQFCYLFDPILKKVSQSVI